MVWGGGNNYSTSRQAVAGQANDETDGYEISTFGDAGYDFHCGEYGLPALTGTGSATSRIKTGQHMRVNGTSGEVTFIKSP